MRLSIFLIFHPRHINTEIFFWMNLCDSTGIKKYWGSFPQQSYKNFYHARGLKNVWRMREQEQWECTYGKIIKNEFPLKNFAFFTNLKFSVSLCRWDPIVKYWGADFVTILSAPRYPNDPLQYFFYSISISFNNFSLYFFSTCSFLSFSRIE